LTLTYYGSGYTYASPLTGGSYNIWTDADALDGGTPGVLLSRFDSTSSGGQTPFNMDQSGTATLSSIVWPQALSDGGFGVSGGSVSGHVSASLHLFDGGSSTLSGHFSASPCY
jgi:hypothetical protein